MTDDQARINADLGVYGGFNGPPLPDGTDKFDALQEPSLTPVDDLSRFVTSRIIEAELQPRGEVDVFASPEQAMAYRYARHVRADCVAFRQIVKLYLDAIAIPNDIGFDVGRKEQATETLLAVANRWTDHHEFDEEWTRP